MKPDEFAIVWHHEGWGQYQGGWLTNETTIRRIAMSGGSRPLTMHGLRPLYLLRVRWK